MVYILSILLYLFFVTEYHKSSRNVAPWKWEKNPFENNKIWNCRKKCPRRTLNLSFHSIFAVGRSFELSYQQYDFYSVSNRANIEQLHKENCVELISSVNFPNAIIIKVCKWNVKFHRRKLCKKCLQKFNKYRKRAHQNGFDDVTRYLI